MLLQSSIYNPGLVAWCRSQTSRSASCHSVDIHGSITELKIDGCWKNDRAKNIVF
jgi:hypothetical protein